MNARIALVVAVAVLAGCGGGGSTPSAAKTTLGKSVQGSVVISIPAGNATTSGHVRYPQFVSPAASSVALSINGGTDTFFDVSAGSSLCVTVAGAGRNCTLTFGAPAGSDSFAFLIFSGANGTGTQLASAATTQVISTGSAFNFTVALNAAIGTVVANVPTHGGTGCPNSLMSFNGISEGCAGSSGAVTIAADDPSGAQITGTAPYATPITITSNDPSVTANPSTITAPGQTTTLSYSGAAFGAGITSSIIVNLTIGAQTIPVTVAARRSYLYVANSNATFGTTPAGGGNVAVYTYGAGGNATPVRTITGLSNPVQPVLDSNGNLYVLDNGPYTTHANPFINVYAPGASGSATPIRQITSFAALTFNSACETMTLSPDGTYLWVLCDDQGTGTLHVFLANANGLASIAQLTSMQDDSWSAPDISMAFDNSGNAYITDAGFNVIGQYVASALPTSGAPFQSIGASHDISGASLWTPGTEPVIVTVDNAGTLYASISYLNATAGAPDSGNEIALWNMSVIPCNNCAPSATLQGTPFNAHGLAGIALDPAGNLYVGNTFANTISVISQATVAAASGAVTNPPVMRTLITTGSGSTAPTGMTIGP